MAMGHISRASPFVASRMAAHVGLSFAQLLARVPKRPSHAEPIALREIVEQVE
jgi:hypothetical protein